MIRMFTGREYLLLLAGAMIGAGAALALSTWQLIKYDSTITAGNAMQALSAILIGLIVAAYINRNMQVDRKEKEIVLSYLELMLTLLDEFEELRDGGPVPKVAGLLKKLATNCTAYRNIILHLNYPRHILDDAGFEAAIASLRTLATDTPIRKIEEYARKADDNEVQQNMIKWAEEKKAILDNEVQAFRHRIFMAQVATNKA